MADEHRQQPCHVGPQHRLVVVGIQQPPDLARPRHVARDDVVAQVVLFDPDRVRRDPSAAAPLRHQGCDDRRVHPARKKRPQRHVGHHLHPDHALQRLRQALAPPRLAPAFLHLVERNVPPLAHRHGAAAPRQHVRGREPAYPLEEGVRVGRPEKSELLVETFEVELRPHEPRGEHGLRLRAEGEGLALSGLNLRVEERLDAEPVARQRQRLLKPVPHGEGEHAVEVRERALDAPLGEGFEHDLRVRVGAEDAAPPFEHGAQLAVVVNLPVEGDAEAAVGREHRLVPRAARVDDRQPPVPQTRLPPLFINGRRTPHALVVVPAVLDGLQHRADAALGV